MLPTLWAPLTGGLWRSLVARLVRDEEAAGSNPVSPTRWMAPGRSAAGSRCVWSALGALLGRGLAAAGGARPRLDHAAEPLPRRLAGDAESLADLGVGDVALADLGHPGPEVA